MVVGGGSNGLTAAYALRERGMSVVVLEAGVIGERREGEKEGGMDGGWQEVEGGSLSAGTGRQGEGLGADKRRRGRVEEGGR